MFATPTLPLIGCNKTVVWSLRGAVETYVPLWYPVAQRLLNGRLCVSKGKKFEGKDDARTLCELCNALTVLSILRSLVRTAIRVESARAISERIPDSDKAIRNERVT